PPAEGRPSPARRRRAAPAAKRPCPRAKRAPKVGSAQHAAVPAGDAAAGPHGTPVALPTPPMNTQPTLSVVVPLFNEEESLEPLVAAVREALASIDRWELILVDDGSTDATPTIAARISAEDPRVRLIRLARNYGQTPAMQAGFDHARGDIVVSMDGDLQNDPGDIPRLVERVGEGYDLVAGYREKRQDRLITRKVPSWVANRIIRKITGVPI